MSLELSDTRNPLFGRRPSLGKIRDPLFSLGKVGCPLFSQGKPLTFLEERVDGLQMALQRRPVHWRLPCTIGALLTGPTGKSGAVFTNIVVYFSHQDFGELQKARIRSGNTPSTISRRLSTSVIGGGRPSYQKSTCLARLTLGPYVVQTWSRNTLHLRGDNPAYPPSGFEPFSPNCWSGFRTRISTRRFTKRVSALEIPSTRHHAPIRDITTSEMKSLDSLRTETTPAIALPPATRTF